MVDYYSRKIDKQILANVGMKKYADWMKSEQKLVKSGKNIKGNKIK
jgi:hypothetical protein